MKMNVNKNVLTSLVVLSLFLLPHSVKAQGTMGGIKGGLNLSLLTVEDVDDNNIVPGFHAGVFGKLMLTERFGLQPEILFSSKGVKTEYNEEFLGFDIADGTTELRLNYIDIPVYLVFQLSEDFNFHLGPYVGILMNANMDTQAEILEFIDIDDEEEIDRENFNNLDAGISGGLGFNFDPLTLGFNYNIGLTEVARDNKATYDLLGNAKNQVIQVYVGLMF